MWVQAGTLAIYGDAGDRWCDEGAPAGRGVPVRTALKWEEAFAQSPTPLTRRVLLRIGFVLGRGGGALPLMTRLVRWYLGGAVATHVRVGNPLATHTLFSVYFGLLIWGGLALRKPRLLEVLKMGG